MKNHKEKSHHNTCDWLIGHFSFNLPLALKQSPLYLIETRWRSYSCYGMALVNGFAILFFVSTCLRTTSCLSTIFWMRSKHLKICLDLWWDLIKNLHERMSSHIFSHETLSLHACMRGRASGVYLSFWYIWKNFR